MTKEKLVKELLKYNFDKTNVEIAIRADFKCEYCDKDMLADMDTYKLWQVDHIIPQFLGLAEKDKLENLALSCVQCNKDLKGKWNPSKNGINEGRENYILAAREYISEKRKIKNSEVDEIRAIVASFKESNKNN